MIKDAYEDYQHYKADQTENRKKVIVIQNGYEKEVQYQDLKVGQIIMIEEDEFCPADILIIHTSDPKGTLIQ